MSYSSISTIDPPVLQAPVTRDEANTTLSEIQSMETSYSSLCNQALETISAFLSYPDLDPTVGERLRILLPKILKQKDKILALISQAQDTLDSDSTDANDDDDNMDPQTIAEYEQTMNEFTTMTQELNQQLELLAKVVRLKD